MEQEPPPDKTLSVTPISDVYPQLGSMSGGHPTAAIHGSGPIVIQPGRKAAVGLGLISAVLAFGVTLAGLMTFATPPTPAAAVAPAAPTATRSPTVAPAPEPGAESATPAPPPAPIPAAMLATHGELALTAEPAAAQLFVDGRSMGNVPFDGVVVAGMHDIRVQAEGFVAWETKLEVVRGERQTLNVVLSQAEAPTVEMSPPRRRKSSKTKSGRDQDGSPRH